MQPKIESKIFYSTIRTFTSWVFNNWGAFELAVNAFRKSFSTWPTCLAATENRIFRKIKSVWPKFYSFDPKMVLHFHFTFKPFPGHAQKRERARERKSSAINHSHRSSSLRVTPSSPHLRSFTVVRSPSQTQTHGEFSFHGWPLYTSNPHPSPHLTSPHLTPPPIHTQVRSTHLTSPHPTSNPHTSPIHIPSNSDMPKSTTHPPRPTSQIRS